MINNIVSKDVPENKGKIVHFRGKCEPCEKMMAFFLLTLGALGFYFALSMSHETYYSPSIIPKITSLIVFFCASFLFYVCLKKEKNTASIKACIIYLFPKDVIAIIVLLLCYALALPYIHFKYATVIFLIASILYLQNGKSIFRTIIIASFVTLTLVIVFRYIFLVILP